MNNKLIVLLTFIIACFFGIMPVFAQLGVGWKVHDAKRPKPTIVTPGSESTQEKAGTAPSDAVVLFDGTDLSAWQRFDGSPAAWKVENGYMEVVEGGGSIKTLEGFGDCQIHIEWSTPIMPNASGQGNGNSGIYLMDHYEIQMLNSFENETYADGQAAAVYGQTPPLVNSSRAPRVWQTYDIIFHRPRFSELGNLRKPATVTVFHNGVLVHYNTEFMGPTDWQDRPPYKQHAEKLPIALQDHGNPMRFRNIWVRDLEQYKRPEAPITNIQYLELTEDDLSDYEGTYSNESGFSLTVKERDGQLGLFFGKSKNFKYLIYPITKYQFSAKYVDSTIDFRLSSRGIDGLTWTMGGTEIKADRE